MVAKSNHDPGTIALGMQSNWPVALGVGIYGGVFGILASAAGLSMLEMVMMSFLVFAGAAQFAALDLWQTPLPIAEIALACLFINLRYVMITASIRPRKRDEPAWKWILAVHFCADENWAVTMAKPAPMGNLAFLLGGGLVLIIGWQGGGLIGFFAGNSIPDPRLIGVDFAFTAAFIGLVGGFWKGVRDLPVWAASAFGAIAGHWWLSGAWFVMSGAAAGIIVACVCACYRRGEAR